MDRIGALLELALEVELALKPGQFLKQALTEDGINAGTIESLAMDLEEIMPVAKENLAFTKPGTPNGFRHRKIGRRIKDLARLRTALHNVMTCYRDTRTGTCYVNP